MTSMFLPERGELLRPWAAVGSNATSALLGHISATEPLSLKRILGKVVLLSRACCHLPHPPKTPNPSTNNKIIVVWLRKKGNWLRRRQYAVSPPCRSGITVSAFLRSSTRHNWSSYIHMFICKSLCSLPTLCPLSTQGQSRFYAPMCSHHLPCCSEPTRNVRGISPRKPTERARRAE